MKAHRCYYCQRASTNVVRVPLSDSMSTELRWICKAQKQCIKRQQSHGVKFIEVCLNPPRRKNLPRKKRRAA